MWTSGIIITILTCFGAICDAAVLRRDHIYGPRYRPLWRKGAKNNFTRDFGGASIKNLIEKAGFIYENYTVTTEDGFILCLSRLVHPENVDKREKGYPLLLMNGFAMSGDSWLVQEGLDSNLAAVWGALGYDVWIGDQRGTSRSTGHTKYNYSSTDKGYWNHSIEEIGVYDYSAFIDFILQKTEHKDLVITCISLGCGYHVALIDARPEYNAKIRGALYFMPLVNNIQRALDMPFGFQMNFLFGDLLSTAYERAGITGTLQSDYTLLRKELWYLCRPFARMIIQMWKFSSRGSPHFPTTDSVCYSVVAVGGAGVKSIRHVQQIYYKGEFAKFNYGREENLKRYGQESPPLFDLSKITSFVAVYYSDTDDFSSVEGVKKTINSFGGPTYECLMAGFNHLDVALGNTFKYILPDVNQVLDSLVGYSADGQRKAMSGKCPSMEWVRGLSD